MATAYPRPNSPLTAVDEWMITTQRKRQQLYEAASEPLYSTQRDQAARRVYAPSGLKLYKHYTVLNLVRFIRFSKPYAAMQEHYAKVDWVQRKEVQELEAQAFPS